ncbi:MAG: hypothetical protein N2Z76_01005 [Treponemataceae bacterium]|nr:hypothetical protein [Treponemataceae bacterium]
MKVHLKKMIVFVSGIFVSCGLLLSCNTLGYGRKVDQVADHSFPAVGELLDNGELKLEIIENVMTQLDVKELKEHQIFCRGKITNDNKKPFSSDFFEKTFRKYIFDGNIITNNQNVFIKELPFVVAAENKPKGYGEHGYGEKEVWFNYSSIAEPNFSVNYHKSLNNLNIIPIYPTELAIITINSRPYTVYAVYEPLYETVAFFSNRKIDKPLMNMEGGRKQLLHNDQKYQIVNRDGKAVAEVYKHRYQIFDSGDSAVNNDSTLCAGLVYTIINVTNILESNTYWYK